MVGQGESTCAWSMISIFISPTHLYTLHFPSKQSESASVIEVEHTNHNGQFIYTCKYFYYILCKFLNHLQV